MQDHAQETVVDRQRAAFGVIDKAMLSEPVHEVADTRPGSAYHFCQIVLTDSGKHRFGSAFLAEMRKQQENPGQTLFTGVEKLIDKIRFISNVAGKQLGDKDFGDGMLIVEQARQLLPLDPDNGAICGGAGSGHAHLLTRKASLAKEITGAQNTNNRFLALFGGDCELHQTSAEEKDCIGGVSLPENAAVCAVFFNGFPLGDSREDGLPIDSLSLVICHDGLLSLHQEPVFDVKETSVL